MVGMKPTGFSENLPPNSENLDLISELEIRKKSKISGFLYSEMIL